MIFLPYLTLFSGDGFVLDYVDEKLASPSLHMYSAPGRGDDGALRDLTQVSVDSLVEKQFKVDMKGDGTGTPILVRGLYEFRVRGMDTDTGIQTTGASGVVEVVDYNLSDKLGSLLNELKMVEERLAGGDHYITRTGLPDGREFYRMNQAELHNLKNRLQNEIIQRRRRMACLPLWSRGGRVIT